MKNLSCTLRNIRTPTCSALVFRFCSVSDFKGKGEMTDGVFYFVRVYLFVFVFFCVYVQASVGMVRHEQDLCFSEGQHEMAFATHVTFEIWYFSKWNRKLVKNGYYVPKWGQAWMWASGYTLMVMPLFQIYCWIYVISATFITLPFKSLGSLWFLSSKSVYQNDFWRIMWHWRLE